MNLQKTIGTFFSRYGQGFTTSQGVSLWGCLSRVDGEDQAPELDSLPMGYRPAHRLRLLTQGDVPLKQGELLTGEDRKYALIAVRPVRLGGEVLYYKSIAYEQEESGWSL